MALRKANCAHCAETIDATSNFCKHCGHVVNEAADSVAADDNAPAMVNKSRMGAIAAFGGVAAIFITAVVAHNSKAGGSQQSQAIQSAGEAVENASDAMVAEVIANAQRQADAQFAAEQKTAPAENKADEVEVVTLCDLTVKEALATEPDMDFRWQYAPSTKEVRVIRGFKAENVFGAALKHTYFCTYSTPQKRITKLTVEGPGGSHRVI